MLFPLQFYQHCLCIPSFGQLRHFSLAFPETALISGFCAPCNRQGCFCSCRFYLPECVPDNDPFFRNTAQRLRWEHHFRYKHQKTSFLSGPFSFHQGWDPFFWIRREPSAIRRGFSGIPVLLGNSFAYFSSIVSHGIVSDFLTQRFSGSILNPTGWLKFAGPSWRYRSNLYMSFPPNARFL